MGQDTMVQLTKIEEWRHLHEGRGMEAPSRVHPVTASASVWSCEPLAHHNCSSEAASNRTSVITASASEKTLLQLLPLSTQVGALAHVTLTLNSGHIKIQGEVNFTAVFL